MDRLLELAELVEKAEGPDRELDREIELAVLPERVSPDPTVPLLAYTASLDAAMSLEPEGFESEEIFAPTDDCLVWTSHLTVAGSLHTGIGKTRVLAQLAARLRARASQ